MNNCTIFQGVTHKLENAQIEQIILSIRSTKYKDQVDNIRELISKGKKEDADRKKKLLQSFTPSGTFDDGRKADKITSYSKFIILDFDNLSPDQLKGAKMKAERIIQTYSAFESPSGKGLKILVPVTSELEQHILAFKQVSAYYSSQLGIPIDQSGKDVCRLCFMSYDPDCYLNIEALPFFVDLNPKIKSIYPVYKNGDQKKDDQIHIDDFSNEFEIQKDDFIKALEIHMEDLNIIFETCVRITCKKFEFLNGNRNNFIHQLACTTNRFGLHENIVISLASEKYDLDASEIVQTVKSVYSNNIAEFATSEFIVGEDEGMESEDVLKSSPFIPDHIFEALPIILKSGCDVFPEKRKRDVLLTSGLSVISGCLPNVSGVYSGEKVYPHLFTFTVAPAGSGKGVMKNAKSYADKYHEEVLQKSQQEKKDYNLKLSEYKRNQKSLQNEESSNLQIPEEPAFKTVFIPANCSASRMIEHLQNNNGNGIICETEADTMSGNKKQDWGDYSPILRAAFHHEKISYSRKTNDEYIEIKDPKIAVVLAGTPAQAQRLLASAEDGLFSRFIYYSFRQENVWQNPSPTKNEVVLSDYFEKLSIDLCKGIHMLELSPTEMKLTTSQWSKLNECFISFLNDTTLFSGDEAASIVYRLGFISFRICMVFTALRKIESADASEKLYCSDTDFNNSIELVKTYLQHSIIMYNNLPNSSESGIFKKGNNKQLFLEALPDEFTTKQAAEIGKQFKLSYSTVSKILPKMVPAYFSQPKSGYYIKIKD